MNADWLTWLLLGLLAVESAAIVYTHSLSLKFCGCPACRAHRGEQPRRTTGRLTRWQ